ncbi:MAG: peptidase M, neutral zinc metallopeptidase site [Goleter apudmare HA4340-LM2]|jgi:hypothetical protein|nr:peptidase M, neutral zinc metallopeptidase site [Goleter apudmare HA4340-LM2]
MSVLDSFNTFSKTLLGIGIIDAWEQAAQTKVASQKSTQLAQNKHLREAVRIAEKAVAVWSQKPGFWERWICQLLLGNVLDKLKQQLTHWQRQVAAANKLAANAKTVLKQDTGDPLQTQALASAIALYERCSQIIHDERVSQLIKQYQKELQRRQQFQILVTQAESHTEQQFFKNAIAAYCEAEKLYSTEAVRQAISTAEAKVKEEEIYDAALQRAKQAQSEGKLRSAIALLENALANFNRADGRGLLQFLQRTVKGKDLFRQGLAAEKAGDFKTSVSLYENAKSLLPDITDCRIRLGIVAIKNQDWKTTLSHLEGLSSEQAAYLRGFAYAQQENLQLANREWQSLSSTAITEQREILKSISQRQRLLSLKKIEQLVKAEKLDEAKTASTEFIQTFSDDQLIEENLYQHIQPRLEARIWEGSSWRDVVTQSEKIWKSQTNITTLHNLAVATYYYAQSDTSKLSNAIIVMSTALANLNHDPTLQDVPWLGKKVDYASVSLEIQRRLETAVDSLKDTNINVYLNLRDLFRLESVTLKLMGESAKQGMMVNDLYLTPGCYSRYLDQWKNVLVNRINVSQKILNSLYTPWGLAVAAFMEGDSQRGIQIQPASNPTSEIEKFAKKFVAYHQGCYQLQQQKWREAIILFQQAKSEIKANDNWQQEIDRLCGLQRQVISEFTEHLQFAQSWYELSRSNSAASYLAEYKAEKIREQLVEKQISLEKALKELQEIKRIDAQNPIVLDLSERIEFQQEMEAIEKLLKNDQFEEAVKRAKKSPHQRIRQIVTDICIDILIKGFKERDLGFEVIYDLGRWAYELCPDDQNVQEIYKFSKELKDIHDLMKRDRFDEAVSLAKKSQHDSIRKYVAEFFILILIKGIENRDLSYELIQKLGRWAYQLCPYEPAFQEIFRSLKLR